MLSFRLSNIKSFAETESIELKPLTIFVGKNSSGKSSLPETSLQITIFTLGERNENIR